MEKKKKRKSTSSSRQKINTETLTLNDTLGQMNLTDLHRTFHPKAQHTHSFQANMEHSPV